MRLDFNRRRPHLSRFRVFTLQYKVSDFARSITFKELFIRSGLLGLLDDLFQQGDVVRKGFAALGSQRAGR